MGKFFSDILKTNGKYSFKRVTAIYVLNVSIAYAFIPIWFPKFPVLEFVMMALIGYSASMIGMTLWQKNLENKNSIKEE
jgi:hypothetical protein